MQSKYIQALEARSRFGELLELAFYKGKQFRIARKNKPMAWLVGEPFMEKVSRIIDHIIEHEPALADSLAITLDVGIRDVIEQGTKAKTEGKIVPIETILDD